MSPTKENKMKRVAIIVSILLLTTMAFALTTEEETFVTQLFNNKDKLIDLYQRSTELSDLADGITDETIPLQIAQLKAQRQVLIDARDAEIKAEKVASQAVQEGIRTTYATQIGEKDAAISSLQSSLNP